MKAQAIAALAVSAAALTVLPAAAQSWYDPQVVLHHTYVEVEGGAPVQGRSKTGIEATGLGASAQSSSLDDDFFGGGLVGYSPVPGVSFEGEGVYNRSHLAYTPTNAYRYLQSPDFNTAGAFRNYSILTRTSVQVVTLGLKYSF